MGENVIVFQGVTIGHLRGQPAPPKIGNNVLIAAGAKVLGSVTFTKLSLKAAGSRPLVRKQLEDGKEGQEERKPATNHCWH